jgi:hypothetical protein
MVFFRPCAPDSAQGKEACWIEDCPPPFSIRHEFKLLVGTVGVCSQCQDQHFQHAHIARTVSCLSEIGLYGGYASACCVSARLVAAQTFVLHESSNPVLQLS